TYFIRNDTLFLVAEEDGEVLGFLGILLIPWESEVLEITVKRSARNRGLGGALMDEAKRRLPEKKVTVIYLEVRESNAPARHLYEKQGFAEEGVRKRYYTDPVEDAVIMSCHL
ncbi:MAG: ribosomal protein S18-alanine N-acetyltransferase, partial [Lachnospiraceae bacterium]|nr:ribosomal protein S18-alanine N-acetyltransferase [Lachnospiraceae bacterium]